MKLKFIPMLFTFSLVVQIVACGGGSDQNTETEGSSDASTATKTATPSAASAGIGVGPIDHVDVASLDPALASSGAEIFQTKCTACHKLEERYIGPALDGVTTRRKPEWIMNMILNPDVMVHEDETAKGLLAEYLAPMTNQNLTEEEARSILVFLLQNDAKGAGGSDSASSQ